MWDHNCLLYVTVMGVVMLFKLRLLLYRYREQVEQRRTKMERLLEWQGDLAEKLGVAIQELQEVPLPSEEELDQLKDHLEILQAERDKRAEMFLNIQVEIKDIMGKKKWYNKVFRVTMNRTTRAEWQLSRCTDDILKVAARLWMEVAQDWLSSILWKGLS